jgi:hypothetical protein
MLPLQLLLLRILISVFATNLIVRLYSRASKRAIEQHIMVDPFSVTVNVLSILQTCAYTIQSLDHLIKKYKNAPAKLIALQSESRLISSSLVTVQAMFHKNDRLAKNLDTKPELRLTVDNTLTGAMAIYKLLDKDLQHLVVPSGDRVDWKKRSYLLFNDALIEQYLSQIRGHLHGLNLLLNCLQL